ncbi:hypothetical protein AVEN_90681-1 [Araneus ventricosus]|uniref:Uncharacterized protein n=1 Tax=Araneus ventricosus TaxID=182803 RepID=A0A4Y2F1F2_ARAVE|nr:hypothetical protein AVEN_90681-1 [Araneus ventricosus]
MHPIRHWLWALPQLSKGISSPFNRLPRMWGNMKSLTLRNEIPTYLIISPQGTKPTIHSPLVEESPFQQTLKPKYRSFRFLANNENLIKSQNTTPSHIPA